MSVNKKIRFEVFKRDKFTCQYCGRSAPDVILNADHIHPESEGGTDDMLNLITSCHDCNSGKSNILLSDDTILKKQQAQLEDLQERREQMEMMLDWQREMLHIEDEMVSNLVSFWSDLVPGFTINEHGLKFLQRWTTRFEFSEIITAIRLSVDQYIKYESSTDSNAKPIPASVEKAFNYIPRVCNGQRAKKDKPYLTDLYYIRGIMRNRLSYINEVNCLLLIEDAYHRGLSIDEMKHIALTARSWTVFQDTIQSELDSIGSSHE